MWAYSARTLKRLSPIRNIVALSSRSGWRQKQPKESILIGLAALGASRVLQRPALSRARPNRSALKLSAFASGTRKLRTLAPTT
jgi:hypothetical protein